MLKRSAVIALSLALCVLVAWSLLSRESRRHSGAGQPRDEDGDRSPQVSPRPTSTPDLSVRPVRSGPAPSNQTGPPRFAPTGKFRVRCGEGTCLVATEVCCDSDEGFKCVPVEQECRRRAECDEAADCQTGAACCYVRGSTVCMDGGCDPSQLQFCSDDAECPSGSCAQGATCTRTGRVKVMTGKKATPPAR